MHTQVDFTALSPRQHQMAACKASAFPTSRVYQHRALYLWGRFLLREREEYPLPGPQVWACMGQQPGALSSKKAMQPLLATGLVQEAAFQCGIQMTTLRGSPPRRSGFHRGHVVFSSLIGAEQRLTQWTEASFNAGPAGRDQQSAAAEKPIKRECSSPPAQPCVHQRCSGHHHHVCDQAAGQYAANKAPTRSQLGKHHCGYKGLEDVPGGEATNDQRGIAQQEPQT